MTTDTTANSIGIDRISTDDQAGTPTAIPRTPDVNAVSLGGHSDATVLQQMSGKPETQEVIAGATALVGWFGLFAAGLFVPTKQYRDELLGSANFGEFIGHFGHFVVVVACYTVTNLLFLSCLSSYLGCMTLRWCIGSDSDQTLPLFAGVSPRRIYVAAILRGFLLYLLVISGLLTFSDESSIVNTQFAQYIRIAGVVSSLGFVTGYDPRLINRFLGRIEDFANQPLQSTK